MAYTAAKTAAELFSVPHTVSQDFTRLLSTPVKPTSHVIFRPFHVVYGPWQSQAFGPGNVVVLRFVDGRLMLAGFTQPVESVDCGDIQSYNETSATWSNGVSVNRTQHTVTNNGVTDHVWNIKTPQYNFYVTPVTF